MAKSVYYGILHPEKGLIGNPWNEFPNEQKPEEIKASELLLFDKPNEASSLRNSHYRSCDVVPVIIIVEKPRLQSDEWEFANEFFTHNPGKRIIGFPFKVPFPTFYSGQKYEIITVAGDKLQAKVDDSCEFRSEGLEWKTSDGNKTQSVIAAWRKIIEE